MFWGYFDTSIRLDQEASRRVPSRYIGYPWKVIFVGLSRANTIEIGFVQVGK
ncbi:MAG: hypothetical protein U0Y10_05485 [Spirosomataceae bacterium]